MRTPWVQVPVRQKEVEEGDEAAMVQIQQELERQDQAQGLQQGEGPHWVEDRRLA